MKYFYDQENDALSLSLVDRAIVESEEVWPGVVVDFDAQGLPVGLDIDSRASEIVDVRGLTAGREIRIAGPELTGSPAVSTAPICACCRESLGPPTPLRRRSEDRERSLKKCGERGSSTRA